MEEHVEHISVWRRDTMFWSASYGDHNRTGAFVVHGYATKAGALLALADAMMDACRALLREAGKQDDA